MFYSNFTKKVEIKENIKPGTIIATFSAENFEKDESEKIEYYISKVSPRNFQPFFAMTEKTGKIYVLDSLPTGEKNLIKIYILAMDSSSVAKNSVNYLKKSLKLICRKLP